MKNILVTFATLNESALFIKKHKITKTEIVESNGKDLILPLYFLAMAEDDDLVEEVFEEVACFA